MERKAIIIGASGSIGTSLLQQLLADVNYSEVLVLARRKLSLDHPKLKQIVLNFDHLADHAAQIKGDVVFCCMGTTKGQTPDEQQYRKIDYQYPLDVAWMAYTNGAQSYHFVSSMGANIDSSIFYSRTKGEAEQDLKTVPFKNIHIYRPSLLDGERTKKRLAETIMNAIMHFINPLLIGKMKKYRSIKVDNVARAMLRQSLDDKRGIFIHESDQIQELSNFNKA